MSNPRNSAKHVLYDLPIEGVRCDVYYDTDPDDVAEILRVECGGVDISPLLTEFAALAKNEDGAWDIVRQAITAHFAAEAAHAKRYGEDDAADAVGGEQNVYSFGRLVEALRTGVITPIMAPRGREQSK